jgi:GMP synthase-like glutamine amidotransferase
MKIGILLTNTDASDFATSHPDDGEKVKASLLLARPAWASDPAVQLDVLPVIQNVFPAQVQDYDAYVLTGSPASVNSADAWIVRLLGFIRDLDAARIPTVGICFGHQAIAAALGGRVARNADRAWGLGQSVTHFHTFGAWMAPQKNAVTLFSCHNEQVVQLPLDHEGNTRADVRVLGGSDFCPASAVAIGDAARPHFFSTQYHPEFNAPFMQELLGQLVDDVDAATLSKAALDVALQHDSALFFEWMAKFLEMQRA